MHKLNRVVEGYNLQVVNLPRIFGKLSQDLPSGSITLPNGEKVFYRINRMQSDGKRSYKSPREVAPMLVEALQSLVESKPFMNQYGLHGQVSLGVSHQELAISIRNLLTQNQHTISYTSTSRSLGPGRGVALVEEINVPLSNLVHVVAVRGGPVRAKGESTVSGMLFLNESDANDQDRGFKFKVISPFVDLAECVGPQRLTEEIISRLKKNFSLIATAPFIEYDEDIFDSYVTQGLAALENKKSNKNKKAKAEEQVADAKEEAPKFDTGWGSVLTEEQYRAMSVQERRDYLDNKSKMANMDQSEEVQSAYIGFLKSGVLGLEYRQHTTNTVTAPLTQEYFLARKIGLSDVQVQNLLGEKMPKFIVQLDSSVPVGTDNDPRAIIDHEILKAGTSAEEQAAALLEETPAAECEGGACSLAEQINSPSSEAKIDFSQNSRGEMFEMLKNVRTLDKSTNSELDQISVSGIQALESALFGEVRGKYHGVFDGNQELPHGEENDFAIIDDKPFKISNGQWVEQPLD